MRGDGVTEDTLSAYSPTPLLPHSPKTMTLPKQTPPVKRPHFLQPATCVDVEHGSVESLVSIRMKLLHGANYNDPAAYALRSYNQVMHSGFSALGRWF